MSKAVKLDGRMTTKLTETHSATQLPLQRSANHPRVNTQECNLPESKNSNRLNFFLAYFFS